MSEEVFGANVSKYPRKVQTYRTNEQREQEISDARKSSFFAPVGDDEKVVIQKEDQPVDEVKDAIKKSVLDRAVDALNLPITE